MVVSVVPVFSIWPLLVERCRKKNRRTIKKIYICVFVNPTVLAAALHYNCATLQDNAVRLCAKTKIEQVGQCSFLACVRTCMLKKVYYIEGILYMVGRKMRYLCSKSILSICRQNLSTNTFLGYLYLNKLVMVDWYFQVRSAFPILHQ